MTHKARKIGTALAASVLAVGVPSLALADTPYDPQPLADQVLDEVAVDVNASEAPTVSEAIASSDVQTQRLTALNSLTADDVVLVSLNDIGLSADQRYSLMQTTSPSSIATLQKALGDVTIVETGSLSGTTRSLADHARLMGVDPASIVAVNVDDSGMVTLYYQ